MVSLENVEEKKKKEDCTVLPPSTKANQGIDRAVDLTLPLVLV